MKLRKEVFYALEERSVESVAIALRNPPFHEWAGVDHLGYRGEHERGMARGTLHSFVRDGASVWVMWKFKAPAATTAVGVLTRDRVRPGTPPWVPSRER